MYILKIIIHYASEKSKGRTTSGSALLTKPERWSEEITGLRPVPHGCCHGDGEDD